MEPTVDRAAPARITRGIATHAALRRASRALGWSVMLLVVVVTAVAVVRFLPKQPILAAYPASTAVYDANGQLLRLTLAADDTYRLRVPLQDVSPLLVEAILLHEDRHFRRHFGVNPVALARGAWQTYVERGNRRGGSTITMQLARLHYRIHTRSAGGKLLQAARAVQLEAMYSKDEILEAYLNLVPCSANIEGVGAASLIYFGKRNSALSLPEALTLAVLPQSPLRRRPGDDSNAALRDARLKLFDRWAGVHPEDRDRRGLVALPLAIRDARALPFAAPHFTGAVLTASRREGAPATEIATTLDLRLQRLVERHVQAWLRTQGRVGIRNAAVLLVDTRDLGVKALLGSADFFDAMIEGQVNGAAARRSPGSTLKPFVYALGFDQGLIHPLTVLKDAPTAFGPFSPENFDGRFIGPVTVRDALIRSRNVPAVAVAAKLTSPGLHEFLRTAGVSGLRAESHYGLSLALGGGEVTMEELATLYAMLANRGVLKPLRYRASDPESRGIRLLSEEAAYLTLDILRENPRPDAPYAPRDDALPVHWKTGTSWGFRDAWTVGSFGPWVLVVWVGNFNGESNPALVGIEAAAPLFFQIADSVRLARPGTSAPVFRTPPRLERIEVCAASGDLPNAHCRQRATTWFIPGKSPIRVSTLHRAVPIDRATGRRACPRQDPATVRTEVYEFWPSDMLRLFHQAGMPRRTAPAPRPDCGDTLRADAGSAPRITSPLRAVSYSLRAARLETETIPLAAISDADAQDLYWFANDGLVARTRRGSTFLWSPKSPGSYLLKVVDDQGRADSRVVRVEVVR